MYVAAIAPIEWKQYCKMGLEDTDTESQIGKYSHIPAFHKQTVGVKIKISVSKVT